MGAETRDRETLQLQDAQTRNYGIDLLRIVAMLMVTVMHAFVRGGVIFGPADIGLNYYLCWIIQALCEVATDCFFLISGYFLVKQPAQHLRTITIWCTVLFYSWIAFFVLLPMGLDRLDHSPLIGSLFPISTNHYWFMTSYIALCFLSPYVNLAVREMEKRQMRYLILILLLLFSVWPIIAPMVMTFEHHGGLTVTWSLVVYLVAAYIRLHMPVLPKKWVCLAAYCGCSAVALLLRFLFVRYGYSTMPALLDYANVILTYNSPLTFFAAIMLFLFFVQLPIHSPAARRLIGFIAPSVLAVYLITEQHDIVVYLWTKWIPIRPLAGNWWFLPYVFMVAISLLLLCCLIDKGRDWIFRTVTRAFCALRAGIQKRKTM